MTDERPDPLQLPDSDWGHSDITPRPRAPQRSRIPEPDDLPPGAAIGAFIVAALIFLIGLVVGVAIGGWGQPG